MAQVILRPDSVISSTGFDASSSDLLGLINDDDLNTFTSQNQTNAAIEVSLENSNEYVGGTITDIVLGATVSKNRAGNPDISLTLIDSNGIILFTQHTVTSSTPVNILNAAVDANSEGEILTPTTIDNLTVKLNPSTQGCRVFELFAIITFTPNLISKGTLKILQGQTKIINGKVTL
jgi:hypothetical protein